MNYDEETHSLLSLNDLRPVHFVNAKQGGLLAHPRNMQHTSRNIHGKAKNCTLISEEWDFHSLRHTHATILYEAGVPMPLIQKRLGHIIFRQQNATQIMLLRKCFLCLMK